MTARKASRSRRIVIDASIARAAGSAVTPSEQGRRTRTFLLLVLELCHRGVFSADILTEWNRHRSLFARRWLSSMYARKKVESIVPRPEDTLLGDRVVRATGAGLSEDEVRKDLPLVVGAINTDSTVASLDERIREHLSVISAHVPELRHLVWVNPAREEPDSIEKWLLDGAPPHPRWRLLRGD